jgi:uncharacterized membrane protein YdjX (TVP38/TMEM64 family)
MSRTAGWIFFTLLLLGLILAPFFRWEMPVHQWSRALLDRRPPWWGISGLLAADVVLPVPSSLVSTASGMLLGFWSGAAASWIGMMAGCLGGYWIGARAGRAAASRLVGTSELERVASASRRFGDGMVVLFRAVPVLAEASVLFAGAVRMPLARFLVVSGLSNLGISIAYAAVGVWSAEVSSFLLAFGGAVLLPLAAILASRFLTAAWR